MRSGRGTEAPRPSDETISLPPRSRPEMNPGYQRPRIKQRGFELFCNDQSCKRSDLRIRRLHAVRFRDRVLCRADLMRRGTEAASGGRHMAEELPPEPEWRGGAGLRSVGAPRGPDWWSVRIKN